MLYWSNTSTAPSPDFASAWRARPRRYACRRLKSTRSSKSTCVWPGAWSGRSQRCRGSTSSALTALAMGGDDLRAMGSSVPGDYLGRGTGAVHAPAGADGGRRPRREMAGAGADVGDDGAAPHAQGLQHAVRPLPPRARLRELAAHEAAEVGWVAVPRVRGHQRAWR